LLARFAIARKLPQKANTSEFRGDLVMAKKRRRGPPWIKRYNAAVNACPKCGAKREEPCVRKNGQPRMSVHRERMKKEQENE
jgi:hypothetical protein